jgi:lipopolysaccharide transport system ATP-binding protein
MNAVKVLCDSAILLENGRVIERGEPNDVVNLYQNMMLKKMHQGDSEVEILKKPEIIHDKNGFHPSSGITTNQVKLVEVKFFDKNQKEITAIESGESLLISCKIFAISSLNLPHYGIQIRDKNGLEIYGVSTESVGITTCPLLMNETITLNCSLRSLPLACGDYSITVGVSSGVCTNGIFMEYCLFSHDVALFKILQRGNKVTFGGMINLDAKLDIISE